MPTLSRNLPLFLIAILLIGVAVPAVAVPAVADAADGFTIALVPDTQNYSEKFPETYVEQLEWIRDVAAERNIKFAIHLGDMVQVADRENEWQVADRAQKALDGKVPYSVLPGNHDGAPGKTELYNRFFSPTRFENAPWYGGNKDGKNDNNYCRFTAAGMRFMVLSLEFNARPETLQWAGEIAAAHPDDRVIVATHAYMSPNGRNGTGDRIWKDLVNKQPNIFMVVSGHVLGTGHQVSTNEAGGPVHEILCDYQGMPNGGDGWLQTLRFVPAEDTIEVVAYSPVVDQFNDKPGHTYTIDYDMIVVEPTKPCCRPTILRRPSKLRCKIKRAVRSIGR